MGPIYQNKTASFISVEGDPTHHTIINPNATVYLMNGASGQSYYTPSPCKKFILFDFNIK